MSELSLIVVSGIFIALIVLIILFILTIHKLLMNKWRNDIDDEIRMLTVEKLEREIERMEEEDKQRALTSVPKTDQ